MDWCVLQLQLSDEGREGQDGGRSESAEGAVWIIEGEVEIPRRLDV